MKKVLLWGWTEPDAVMAVEKLKMAKQIEIADWIGDIKELKKSYINFLYNPPNLGSFALPRHDQGLTDEEQIKFLHMFYRETRSKGVNFYEQINIAKNYFRYFLWLLSEKNISHVLFSIPPLIGYDYLCYLAAKRLNIEVTMCYQSLFPDRFFCFKELETFGNFSNISDDDSATEIPNINWGYKKDLFYMKNGVRENPPNPLPMLIRQSLRYGIRKSSKPLRYSGVIENYIQAKDYNEFYQKHAKKSSELDIKQNYVYFPLHLQPELTTTGFGGAYSDQLDAIDRLSDMIPADWKVFVKENPKQSYKQRGAEFYRRLSTLGNVVYIGKEVDTYWLMENCQFVATITGTAGWESITGGKPCLYFGLPWYASIPGAIAYTPTIQVNDILNTTINQDEQSRAFSAIYRKTRLGLVDRVYRSICHDYSPEKNVLRIHNFLYEEILKKPT